MPKICYVEKNFGVEALARIEKANEIIAEYTNEKRWKKSLKEQAAGRKQLGAVSTNWSEVVANL